jgi:sugar lactone lactonase YvrE
MANCTVLVDDGNLCGEAPLWDAQQNQLYWVDCLSSKIFSYNWAAKKREIVLADFEVNGCALNRPGGLVLVNNSGVWLWEKNGSAPVLVAAQIGNAKLQLNDCIADPRGRLLSGSCFYSPSEQFPLGHLFCIENDGTVHILDDGFHLANGLCFSPDARTLYFADSVQREIYSFSYDPEHGKVSNRRVFVKLASTAGLPDGVTADAEGFIWCAEWYGGCVARYDPDGKLERRISLPAKQISSLAFGGPDLTDIFITSAGKSEPMPVMPPGYDPVAGVFGGALYHLNLGIAGRAEYQASIQRKG